MLVPSLNSRILWLKSPQLHHQTCRSASHGARVSELSRLRLSRCRKRKRIAYDKPKSSAQPSRSPNRCRQPFPRGQQLHIGNQATVRLWLQQLLPRRRRSHRLSLPEHQARLNSLCDKLLQRRVLDRSRRTSGRRPKVMMQELRRLPKLVLLRMREACQSLLILSQRLDLSATFPCHSTRQRPQVSISV